MEEKFREHVSASCVRKFSPLYFTVGIVEETSELFQELNKSPKEDKSILLETGDVLWYVYGLCKEMELVQPLATRSEKTFTKDDLFGIVGDLAGSVKKMSRGDKPIQEFIPRIQDNIGSLLGALQQISGGRLETAMEMNIEKINQRKLNGTIRGDGNHR